MFFSIVVQRHTSALDLTYPPPARCIEMSELFRRWYWPESGFDYPPPFCADVKNDRRYIYVAVLCLLVVDRDSFVFAP